MAFSKTQLDLIQTWRRNIEEAEGSLVKENMPEFWAAIKKMKGSFKKISQIVLSEQLSEDLSDEFMQDLHKTYSKLQNMQSLATQQQNLTKKRMHGKCSVRKITYAYNNPGKTHGRNLRLYAKGGI